MSKMDNLRAMREARYEESRARAKLNATPTRTPAPVRPERSPTLAVVPDPPETGRADADQVEPEQAEALCGHRNMGGRTCTREAGHAAKSHRYS
jgi:hypothetical protein